MLSSVIKHQIHGRPVGCVCLRALFPDNVSEGRGLGVGSPTRLIVFERICGASGNWLVGDFAKFEVVQLTMHRATDVRLRNWGIDFGARVNIDPGNRCKSFEYLKFFEFCFFAVRQRFIRSPLRSDPMRLSLFFRRSARLDLCPKPLALLTIFFKVVHDGLTKRQRCPGRHRQN